ncbi:hypothetical protein B0I26_10379 [Anoxybacillus vitaminiphilus]|uniref:Uncharacterized protein n=1 Tax=Paranoxybacillus vitaminiphilus TaxID=581036 RepID=A0A327YLB8_9BACL|nr:hypothetical protein [Anoxybacillus vitaminiphilus]RAK21127.1 hypothetical protein B0I26_10379 [Anoxybacillus vitaminiphilus]
MELELKRIGQLIAPWGGTRTSVEFFRKYREAFEKVESKVHSLESFEISK